MGGLEYFPSGLELEKNILSFFVSTLGLKNSSECDFTFSCGPVRGPQLRISPQIRVAGVVAYHAGADGQLCWPAGLCPFSLWWGTRLGFKFLLCYFQADPG